LHKIPYDFISLIGFDKSAPDFYAETALEQGDLIEKRMQFV